MNHKSIILLCVLFFVLFIFLIPLAFKNILKEHLEERIDLDLNNVTVSLTKPEAQKLLSRMEKNQKTDREKALEMELEKLREEMQQIIQMKQIQPPNTLQPT